ncbi:hypothetical protein [Haloglycomyces albus]|uniref:hypothetical protein n=1 Tax=Haloglycomyces albus TaxID=526067 RepID=UPI00046D69E9|nr:hypothetical protein [Haloglycomyces albus]
MGDYIESLGNGNWAAYANGAYLGTFEQRTAAVYAVARTVTGGRVVRWDRHSNYALTGATRYEAVIAPYPHEMHQQANVVAGTRYFAWTAERSAVPQAIHTYLGAFRLVQHSNGLCGVYFRTVQGREETVMSALPSVSAAVDMMTGRFSGLPIVAIEHPHARGVYTFRIASDEGN